MCATAQDQLPAPWDRASPVQFDMSSRLQPSMALSRQATTTQRIWILPWYALLSQLWNVP